MPSPPPAAPARVSWSVHLKRAFGWNLARVVPSERESAALSAAGISDPAVARYAAWRRSLLVVAAVPLGLTLVVAVLGAIDDGFDALTALGTAVRVAGLVATAALPAACLLGVATWTRPGATSRLFWVAWGVVFLVPFVEGLLPVDAFYRFEEVPAADAAGPLAEGAASVEAERAEKVAALRALALDFVMSAGFYLTLLPAVLALLPGAVNGCLRVKSLLPAAQLPGWLMVCAAPVFLLFWLVLLAVGNQAAQSPTFVLGTLLWAGGPLLYTVAAGTFVRPQISSGDAARIARVRRAVGLVSLAGVALLAVFATTSEVAGLTLVGFEEDAALSTGIASLADADDEVDLDDLREAYADATSLVYAMDLSSYRFVLDVLAKMLLLTVVFADLALRATLAGWRDDRALRGSEGAAGHDASAEAALRALRS
jgi:hypothetical protein